MSIIPARFAKWPRRKKWDKFTYFVPEEADYPISQKNVSQFYEKGLNEVGELTRYDGLKNRLDYNEFIRIRNQVE